MKNSLFFTEHRFSCSDNGSCAGPAHAAGRRVSVWGVQGPVPVRARRRAGYALLWERRAGGGLWGGQQGGHVMLITPGPHRRRSPRQLTWSHRALLGSNPCAPPLAFLNASDPGAVGGLRLRLSLKKLELRLRRG
eukprot:1442552-Rhodomonas_salina.2